MANPNGLVVMPTRDNMSLTQLAKLVFCHEGNLIDLTSRSRCKVRVGLHRHVAKIAITYLLIYCFLLLSLGCFFVLIGNYYLPSQRKHKVQEGKDA